ncbi:MAG: hypothetical protein A3F40_05100 [Chlamydiae bacterium RIFCSPHIGHO2_12_FULL_27_8]|nr:MAG: hypothetical protein A3F40_05100 [Chlamydiae bacterium RIFCSPHIGHO2_12_FULL_27_8]OGN64905.1 MAG: hypothetical protein A2888_03070 [Chlamydiae bacterium RIFCSPLOWO2_01_FULL_28_7]
MKNFIKFLSVITVLSLFLVSCEENGQKNGQKKHYKKHKNNIMRHNAECKKCTSTKQQRYSVTKQSF